MRDILHLGTDQRTARDFAKLLVREVAKRHGVLPGAILSNNKQRAIVLARHDAVIAIRRAFPHWSTPQIGRLFGQHHTTILNALGQLSRVRRSTKVAPSLEEIRAAIPQLLTPRQSELFDFIAAYADRHGRSPSRREMADAIGVETLGGIHNLLVGLRRAGYLTHLDNDRFAWPVTERAAV